MCRSLAFRLLGGRSVTTHDMFFQLEVRRWLVACVRNSCSWELWCKDVCDPSDPTRLGLALITAVSGSLYICVTARTNLPAYTKESFIHK
jgi:hypothetical protein